ncbi:MAG: lysyl oxidase family protein [Actinomycetota bacterium]
MRVWKGSTALIGLQVLVVLALTAGVALGDNKGGTLKKRSHPVLWSGAVDGQAPPSGEVPECQAVSCDRFDLTLDLPNGVWDHKPGGLQVAIRWTAAVDPNDAALTDNLLLYVYRDGTLVAASAGIISTAQSMLIPSASDGLYSIYVAFDPTSPSPVVEYEGLAEVEHGPKAKPLRRLLPDLASRPQRNVTFDTPPPIFFEQNPIPGESCHPSEKEEEEAQTCLRFDQVLANVGEGPLQLRFVLPHDPSSTERDVLQRVFWSDDPAHFDQLQAGEWEFHPTHDHVHFTSFAVSNLWSSNELGEQLGPEPVTSGRKVSFCVVDVEIDAWADKGDGPRTYNAPDCLFPTESDEDNDYLVQGITAGWADVYEWYLPDQYIEVTGLTDGLYLLETIVDPDETILEANESNNCGSVLIQLSGMGTDSPSAELLGKGPPC